MIWQIKLQKEIKDEFQTEIWLDVTNTLISNDLVPRFLTVEVISSITVDCSHFHYLHVKRSPDKDKSFFWVEAVLEEIYSKKNYSRTRRTISALTSTTKIGAKRVYLDYKSRRKTKNIPRNVKKNNHNETMILENKEEENY